MPNYSNGKIYKITGTNSEGSSITYYGSTTKNYLCARMAQHKYDAKYKNNSSKQVVDCEDCEITLIEQYPCNSKDALIARERFYVQNNNCVNKNVPGRSQKEYHNVWNLKNREHINEYQRQWRLKNKLRLNNII